MTKRYRIKCSKGGRHRIYTCAELAGNCVGVGANTVRKHLKNGTLVNGWKLQRLPWNLTPEEQEQAQKQKRQGVFNGFGYTAEPGFAIGMKTYRVSPSAVQAIARNTPAGQIPEEYRVGGAPCQ